MRENIPTMAELREAYQSTGDGLDFKRRFFERGEEFDRAIDTARAADAEETGRLAQQIAAVRAWNSQPGMRGFASLDAILNPSPVTPESEKSE